MAHPAGESESFAVRLHSDRRLMLQFRAGLLAYRELNDAIGLTVMASNVLADARTGKNGRHSLAVELADVMASVRTRFWLATRPKKREYSRLLGVHLGNPGSVERLSEEGDENGGSEHSPRREGT